MAYERTFDLPIQTSEPPCIHLRSKQIYVTGNPDPDDPRDAASDRYSCWCNKTQHVKGPDNELVERSQCISGRACFVGRYS